MPDLLTPAVLSKLPLGLLGFFGIKNGGQYPQYLQNNIQPDLDMLEILAANYGENIAGAASPVAVGAAAAIGVVSGAAIVVPSAEIWLVSKLGLVCNTGAAVTGTYSLLLQNLQTNSASLWHVPLSGRDSIIASTTQYTPCSPQLFWMRPQDALVFYVSVVAGGALNLSTSFRITRFPF